MLWMVSCSCSFWPSRLLTPSVAAIDSDLVWQVLHTISSGRQLDFWLGACWALGGGSRRDLDTIPDLLAVSAQQLKAAS